MEWMTWKQNAGEHLKKYKYLVLILLAGLFLMALPEGKEEPPVQQRQEEASEDLQQQLSEILSHVSGAGKVEVLLTEAAGAQTLYQTNDDRSTTENARDLRTDTVLLTGPGREETGLVRQINPPQYQGAIVVCQGAEDARVRLALVNAVGSVTGLSSDKISVLKMK